MPSQEKQLTTVAKSQFFSKYEKTYSYWQLAPAEDSQDCQSFTPPKGAYSSTKVFQGDTIAVPHLQSSLTEAIPTDVNKNILCWLDEVILDAPTVNCHFMSIQKLFALCA